MLKGCLPVVIIAVGCLENFSQVSHEMSHRVACPWCIWFYSSMFGPHLFGKVFKFLIFPTAGVMANADVDVTISTAEKQEYKLCTTSTYFLLESDLKTPFWKCSQGPFGSSLILSGSCCLLFVTAWQGRHSSTARVSLNAYGFRLSALKLMQSDLSGNTFRVPQGSILGPILLIIFLSDLFLVVQIANFASYVDDNTIYDPGDNIE